MIGLALRLPSGVPLLSIHCPSNTLPYHDVDFLAPIPYQNYSALLFEKCCSSSLFLTGLTDGLLHELHTLLQRLNDARMVIICVPTKTRSCISDDAGSLRHQHLRASSSHTVCLTLECVRSAVDLSLRYYFPFVKLISCVSRPLCVIRATTGIGVSLATAMPWIRVPRSEYFLRYLSLSCHIPRVRQKVTHSASRSGDLDIMDGFARLGAPTSLDCIWLSPP